MDNFDERDKKLIEEHEKYEKEYFENVIEVMLKEEALDNLIAERMEYIDDSFDFEPSPEYKHLEELYYDDYDSQFQEKISDVDDYIDYPDGPDENLSGVTYGEQFNVDLEQDYEIEFEMNQLEEISEDFYGQLVDNAFLEYQNDEEKYMDELIKQHLEEEKEFLDKILVDVIVEENYFEKSIDELILDEAGLDYEPELFDYENNLKIKQSELKIKDNQVYENKDEIESVFKEYYTKDDTLNKIVKQKIKEEKFDDK